MLDKHLLVQQLRGAIGMELNYQGVRCIVVELIGAPLTLVLQSLETHSTVQDDQLGTPKRRVTEIFTIPCLDEDDGENLHQELEALGLPFK